MSTGARHAPLVAMVPAVVLTSQTSHAIALAVIRALGMMGVPVTLADYEDGDSRFVSKYVTGRIKIPHPERDEAGLLDVLLTHAPGDCRPVLIPADDETLLVVSRHKAALEPSYVVACNGRGVTERVVDKCHTYETARAIGLPVPWTVLPTSIGDVERYAATVQFPCVVKPCFSHRYFERFRTKMVKVNDAGELLAEYLRATESGIDVMIQEFIPGDAAAGVNYNSFVWDDKPVAEFTAAKVRLAQPPFGVPRVVVSRDVPEIIEPGRRMLRAVGFRGYSCMEFKRDARDGVYKFMEINGRHNRSGLLALRCGINFPWIEYQTLLSSPPWLPAARPREEVYWIDEFNDVRYSFLLAGREGYSLSEYLRPYLRSRVFATCSATDPWPFIKRCIDAVKIGLGSRRPRSRPRVSAALELERKDLLVKPAPEVSRQAEPGLTGGRAPTGPGQAHQRKVVPQMPR